MLGLRFLPYLLADGAPSALLRLGCGMGGGAKGGSIRIVARHPQITVLRPPCFSGTVRRRHTADRGTECAPRQWPSEFYRASRATSPTSLVLPVCAIAPTIPENALLLPVAVSSILEIAFSVSPAALVTDFKFRTMLSIIVRLGRFQLQLVRFAAGFRKLLFRILQGAFACFTSALMVALFCSGASGCPPFCQGSSRSSS